MRQFWNITSGIYAKYHIHIMLLFVHTTTRKRFVIFTCRYFKLSWNTTALSQSDCRNFSCSSIRETSCSIHWIEIYPVYFLNNWGRDVVQGNKCCVIALEENPQKKRLIEVNFKYTKTQTFFRKVHILYKLYQFTWKACSILCLLAKVPWSFNVSDLWQTHVFSLFLFSFLPSFLLWDQKESVG